ncbi:uncharacterized protein LOC125656872 [Ostrea edulis]|uniref:uncharacterized protein LOC125656872 n=1 Tax=Ostrea edulis TaxID=37623 RepID=UPI0024AFD656|nr:uncharacterized protein LOC125656872 [Ostrea edulis]
MLINTSSRTRILFFTAITFICILQSDTQSLYHSQEECHNTEERIVRLESELIRLRREHVESGRTVAFTALLSKDTTVSAYAVVKYDHVMTNWGGAYQPTTGVFTAPYNGLYSISCTLMSYYTNPVHLEVVKNGIRLSVVYSANRTYPQSSQTLQLLLKKDDRIWIRSNNDVTRTIHDRSVYNVFSGFLIKEL